MEFVIIEKIIEFLKELWSTNDEDEIVYPIDEFRYNKDYD